MSKALTKFDAAATLRDSEGIAQYMAAAFETRDPRYISHALGMVARAKGMSEIARTSGLSREHLYRSFSENGNPTLKSVLAVMDALGVQLSATTTDDATVSEPKSRATRKPEKKAMAKKAKPNAEKRSKARTRKNEAA